VSGLLCPATAPRRRGSDATLWVRRTPVAALYRFFPTEYMEGQRNLDDLVTSVRSGQTRTLSSFGQIYTQSKQSFARAWALAHRGELSSADEQTLARYIPDSRELPEVPPGQLIAEQPHWVIKRAMGRVGDEVFVGALLDPSDWAGLIDHLTALYRERPLERWIAQRFIPQRPLPTPFGDQLVTLGVYLLDGQFVGYFARLSPHSHVSHDALCVPVFVQTEVR
jgi:hypothetical protein